MLRSHISSPKCPPVQKIQQSPSPLPPLFSSLDPSLSTQPSVKVWRRLCSISLLLSSSLFSTFGLTFLNNVCRCQKTKYTRTDTTQSGTTRTIRNINTIKVGFKWSYSLVSPGGSWQPYYAHRDWWTEQKTKTTPKSEESDEGGKDKSLGALLSKRGEFIVSDPPKQKMVGTVISPDCFTAIGESEVLIAITARNYQMIGFWRDVSGGSASRRIMPLEAPVDCAAALGLVA